MKKKALWIASILTGAGLLLTLIGLWSVDFDLSRLNTAKTVTTTFEITEDFQNISIDIDTADVRFLPSSDGHCKVICSGLETMPYTAQSDGKTLTIRQENHRKWYDYIGIFVEKTEVTVYLPQMQYESLQFHSATGDMEVSSAFCFDKIHIKTSTGDISLSAAAKHSVYIHTDTGDVAVSGTACNAVFIEVSTGDIRLTNVTAAESLRISSSTGDVTLCGCDAGSIQIQTDTGDISGTLLSGKTFYADTDTGDIRIPSSTGGGMCRLTTDTGDITIKIQ